MNILRKICIQGEKKGNKLFQTRECAFKLFRTRGNNDSFSALLWTTERTIRTNWNNLLNLLPFVPAISFHADGQKTSNAVDYNSTLIINTCWCFFFQSIGKTSNEMDCTEINSCSNSFMPSLVNVTYLLNQLRIYFKRALSVKYVNNSSILQRWIN